MVLYIHETAAWADTAARVKKIVSSFLAHGDLAPLTEPPINQSLTPPQDYLSSLSAAGHIEAASESSGMTAPAKIPQNTSLRKGAPPLPVNRVLSLHYLTALPLGIHRATSVTPFLYIP